MLRYESAGKVGVSAARSILEEIGSLQRTWWRGALGLDPSEDDRPAILKGKTALFHPPGAIPDEDDVFMAFADAAFIIERLAAWAKKYRIKWRLSMHDEDWGAIDPTGPTKPLREQLGKWAGRAKVFETGPASWAIPAERRETLLARHSSRKAPGPPP
ncbi:MAG: hypothetical protein JO332_20270 [Planctomycetaceae bacterium]|nr:hypothetical protein [Planctomycetaceae bacterium]